MIPKGTKVRIWRDDGSVAKDYRTKELTVDQEGSRVPWVDYNGNRVGFVHHIHLIPANAVIHVETEEEYDEMMQELEGVGYSKDVGPNIPATNDFEFYGLCEVNGRATASAYLRGYVEKYNLQIIPFSVLKAGKQWEETEGLLSQPFNPKRRANEVLNELLELHAKQQILLQDQPNQTFMQKLTTGVKKFLKGKDDRTLYQAGYLNGTFELSQEGIRSFINNLYLAEGDFKKAKEGMVEEASEIIGEGKN